MNALTREKALAALAEVEAYFANRSDVIDGDYGQPEPNEEMRMSQELDDVRRFLEGGAP